MAKSEWKPMTPLIDAATRLELEDRFWKYGGKKARLCMIPAVRKNLRTGPKGVYINATTSGMTANDNSARSLLGGVGCMEIPPLSE